MENKLYFGIDLGTTNSAICYGYLDGEDKLRTQICKTNRLTIKCQVKNKKF